MHDLHVWIGYLTGQAPAPIYPLECSVSPYLTHHMEMMKSPSLGKFRAVKVSPFQEIVEALRQPPANVAVQIVLWIDI